MRTERETVWIEFRKPKSLATIRLFCFHHAGGGAHVFSRWADRFPPGVEICPVQLPGHGRHAGHAPSNMEALGEELVGALEGWLTLPFALFGHSMGSAVAFELALALRRRRLALPRHLFVSGRRPPSVPTSERVLYVLPDADLVEALQGRYGAIPSAIMAEPELLARMVPLLRADMQLIETYSPDDNTLFEFPITAFAGEKDPTVDRAVLEQWGRHTRLHFEAVTLPGDHFYLNEPGRLIETIVQKLQDD